MQLGHWMLAGGIVMVPLLGFSIVAIALSVERLRFWMQNNRRQRPIVQQVLQLYQSKNAYQAIGVLKNNLNLPIARIFLAALQLEEPTTEEFRLALETEAQAELPHLKRFNTVFDTIITVSPLLGLLGTVTGLITSFASLDFGNIGGTQTVEVTGGISEALISTAAGLVVAIMTLIFANTFRGMYQRQLAYIQEYGGQLELIHRRQYEHGGLTHATAQ